MQLLRLQLPEAGKPSRERREIPLTLPNPGPSLPVLTGRTPPRHCRQPPQAKPLNSRFGLHSPKPSASHPRGVPRSLSPGWPGLLEEMGPFNPSAPALGVVYFSSGCQSNGNNSGRRNPLNTTAQADPDQWKPGFASWFLPFFSHIPKSIFSETKNLPSPHTELKLFSKLDPLSSSWHAWVSLIPRLQGEGGKPAFRLAAQYPSGGPCPGGSSSERLCKLLYSKPK